MTHTVTITESERQAIMLALGKLCNERPGWDYFLGEIATKFPDGLAMYQQFRDMEANHLLESIGGMGNEHKL